MCHILEVEDPCTSLNIYTLGYRDTTCFDFLPIAFVVPAQFPLLASLFLPNDLKLR